MINRKSLTKTLKTEKLIAYLAQDENGKSDIKRVEAPQFVTIKTAKETATGNRGTYNVKSDIAELKGDVKIMQDKNELLGERAEVNMKTGLSRIFAATDDNGTPGRVRGVFYPKSNKDSP